MLGIFFDILFEGFIHFLAYCVAGVFSLFQPRWRPLVAVVLFGSVALCGVCLAVQLKAQTLKLQTLDTAPTVILKQ